MDIQVGKVTHYFSHLGVAVVELCDELKVGDTIQILGHLTDFEQPVGSMEVNHHKILSSGPGSEVAIKVLDYVSQGDLVFRCAVDVGEKQTT